MAKFETPYLKELLAHCSTDETRFHLTGVHYDGEFFVATDGHRLMAVRGDGMMRAERSQIKPGETHERDAFKLGHLKSIDCKYPNWKQLVPDANTYGTCFRVTIPPWFKDIKRPKKNEMIGINNAGQFTTGQALVYINPYYLSVFAGLEVDIAIKGAIEPILIMPTVLNKKTLPDWQAVIMPMRGGARPVEVLKEPGLAVAK